MTEHGQDWRVRFQVPYLLTVRPVAGDADLQLVVDNRRDSAVARIYDGSSASMSSDIPFPVGFTAALSPDGRWIVDLDDDGGSEVGSLTARPVDGGPAIRLTPERPPYVLRGLEFSADGSTLLVTAVDDDGYHLLVIPAAPWGEPRVIYSSLHEAWYGHISADGALASIDVTEQNPGIRRPAVTVLETATGAIVSTLDDLPAGPIRGVRFSPIIGDARLLVFTERTGYARPCIWDPVEGSRIDLDLPDLGGEVMPLDWHPESESVLAVHSHEGIQRLLLCGHDGRVTVVGDGEGSYANPDVANVYPFYSTSYLAPNGAVRIVGSRWDTPIHLREIGPDGASTMLVPPASVPVGRAFESAMIESRDGTPIQLWWAIPGNEPRGTIFEVHGGPNLVTVDEYSPSAQSWLDEGFIYASLNYRGSVTFGRDFREGFWGVGGDREIEDIRAAIQWLEAKNLATPATTFITGPSYGGHLTLLSLGRLPALFAGGLAHVAMADWAAAFDDMNPALKGAWTAFLGGTPEEVPDIIERFSAVNFVAEVTGSAWLNQGAKDTRTPAAQAQRYADELKAAGGDVVIDWFDAGHEPTGLAGMERDQARMFDLVDRTLSGLPWSGPAN